jgi:hypothetical protein
MSSSCVVIPLKKYDNLLDTKILQKELSNIGGVYSIFNIKFSKQYIGSSLNLYPRLIYILKVEILT